jgi:hypothetical protein
MALETGKKWAKEEVGVYFMRVASNGAGAGTCDQVERIRKLKLDFNTSKARARSDLVCRDDGSDVNRDRLPRHCRAATMNFGW